MEFKEKDKILFENSKEFYLSGKDNYKKKRYNAATDSFFKAIVTLCDFSIYNRTRTLPSNHNERFDLLKINFPEVFKIVSGLFKRYRRTYNMKADKEDANETKNGFKEAVKILGIKEEMQEFLEKK